MWNKWWNTGIKVQPERQTLKVLGFLSTKPTPAFRKVKPTDSICLSGSVTRPSREGSDSTSVTLPWDNCILQGQNPNPEQPGSNWRSRKHSSPDSQEKPSGGISCPFPYKWDACSGDCVVINNQKYDYPEQEGGNFPEKKKKEMGTVMLGKA